MTRPELIKYISQNSGENESWGNLVTKKTVELEQIYDYIQKVKDFNDESGLGETTIDPVLPKIEISTENYGDDGISLSNEQIDELIFEKSVEEEVVKPKIIGDGQEYTTMNKKPSALSMSEQKLYARTGRLPKVKVKINKYTRFNDDDVKFGF